MLVGLLVLQLLLACQGCLVSFGPLANSITLRAFSSPRRVPEPSFFYILASRIFYAVGMSGAARGGRIVRGSPRWSSAVAASFPLINFPLCRYQVPLKTTFCARRRERTVEPKDGPAAHGAGLGRPGPRAGVA